MNVTLRQEQRVRDPHRPRVGRIRGDRGPDGSGLLYVPVRPGPAGCAARLFRTPLGERTAVGFTSAQLLAATLGPDQRWITLAEPAVRALVEPLGVTGLTVDPQFAAPAPAPEPADGRSAWRDWDPQAIGVLRVTGVAAAVVSCVNLLIG